MNCPASAALESVMSAFGGQSASLDWDWRERNVRNAIELQLVNLLFVPKFACYLNPEAAEFVIRGAARCRFATAVLSLIQTSNNGTGRLDAESGGPKMFWRISQNNRLVVDAPGNVDLFRQLEHDVDDLCGRTHLNG